MSNLYIFDMGDVVITKIQCVKRIGESLGLDSAEFMADFRHYEFPLMEGYIETQTYWRHIEHRYHLTIEGEPFETFFNPILNPVVVSLLDRLRSRGERVVCGSNTFACQWEKLRAMGVFKHFDQVYASHEMQLIKPEAEFYQYIMEKEGFTPERTWFTDDLKANTDAAAKLGIHTVTYDYKSDASNAEVSAL